MKNKPQKPQPVKKLTPPHFPVELIDFTRKGIALSQSVEVVKRRVWL